MDEEDPPITTESFTGHCLLEDLVPKPPAQTESKSTFNPDGLEVGCMYCLQVSSLLSSGRNPKAQLTKDKKVRPT